MKNEFIDEMCYNCTHVLPRYKLKKAFKEYEYWLCHYCEWEIKETIFNEGECHMFGPHNRLVKLKKSNIKDIVEYEQWLDSCT